MGCGLSRNNHDAAAHYPARVDVDSSGSDMPHGKATVPIRPSVGRVSSVGITHHPPGQHHRTSLPTVASGAHLTPHVSSSNVVLNVSNANGSESIIKVPSSMHQSSSSLPSRPNHPQVPPQASKQRQKIMQWLNGQHPPPVPVSPDMEGSNFKLTEENMAQNQRILEALAKKGRSQSGLLMADDSMQGLSAKSNLNLHQKSATSRASFVHGTSTGHRVGLGHASAERTTVDIDANDVLSQSCDDKDALPAVDTLASPIPPPTPTAARLDHSANLTAKHTHTPRTDAAPELQVESVASGRPGRASFAVD